MGLNDERHEYDLQVTGDINAQTASPFSFSNVTCVASQPGIVTWDLPASDTASASILSLATGSEIRVDKLFRLLVTAKTKIKTNNDKFVQLYLFEYSTAALGEKSPDTPQITAIGTDQAQSQQTKLF